MDPTKCCSLFLVRLQYNIDEWFPRYCCSLGSRSVVEEEAAVWGKWLEGGWGLRLRLLSDFFQSARLSGASSSTERVAKLNFLTISGAAAASSLLFMSDSNANGGSAVSVFTLVLVASSPSSVLHTASLLETELRSGFLRGRDGQCDHEVGVDEGAGGGGGVAQQRGRLVGQQRQNLHHHWAHFIDSHQLKIK